MLFLHIVNMLLELQNRQHASDESFIFIFAIYLFVVGFRDLWTFTLQLTNKFQFINCGVMTPPFSLPNFGGQDASSWDEKFR